eukprot:TRINITY_DN5056_c0_g1_i3.p2 TRINITY_DN5056_c0_g1~~TRINITY_DN5056_c0_g1_i3.p2  ORF type:complete len:215 (-),score=8.60 TRINITY_DN5056_c0_g1_i3:66-710(-)
MEQYNIIFFGLMELVQWEIGNVLQVQCLCVSDQLCDQKKVLQNNYNNITLLLQQPEVILGNQDWDRDEMMISWKSGVFDDRDKQWQESYSKLKTYKMQIGDAHIGFRDEDPIQLVRWANKQRSDYNHNHMKENRKKNLQLIHFEFDAEVAEWNCWFNELKKYGGRLHLGSEADMKITNWCSVQRVARKCCVLQQERVDKLNSIGFDWAAADALS